MNLNLLFNPLIDIFFPSYCVNCGRLVRREECSICKDCCSNIDYLTDKCDKCSSTLIEGNCTICPDRKMYVEKHIIIAKYSGVMKEILHNYKFNKVSRLSVPLSNLLTDKIAEISNDIDLITFVPINRKKKRVRGFNQSQLIALEAARKLKKKCKTLLKEKYNFRTQKKLGYRERFLNILGRYNAVNIKSITGKRIILVDDVMTTGATVNECARILKEYGAEKVYSFTVAGVNYR